MPRSYVHVKQLGKEILDMKTEGISNEEIGKKFGLSVKQVKNLFYRQTHIRNNTERAPQFKRCGRPRKYPITSQRELELENKRLKMENELLQDFLKEIERG